MKISELSNQTGVSVRSLRYYEEKNLLHPTRLENGYRIYADEDIGRVKTIQLYLSVGLTADEISHIMNCPPEQHGSECKTMALTMYEKKLVEINEKIEVLQMAKAYIENKISYWKEV